MERGIGRRRPRQPGPCKQATRRAWRFLWRLGRSRTLPRRGEEEFQPPGGRVPQYWVPHSLHPRTRHAFALGRGRPGAAEASALTRPIRGRGAAPSASRQVHAGRVFQRFTPRRIRAGGSGRPRDQRRTRLSQEAKPSGLLNGVDAQAIKQEAGFKARRWVVERTPSWMNRFRRILTRWEKKAANYLAMLHLVLGIITYRCAGLFG